ncbi:MAG: hypothetical protein WAL74_12535, partial [Candidatus Acidiferrales bacterium]
MRPALLLAFVFLFASPTQPQQGAAPPSKETCKDICLEKEVADNTRAIMSNGGRIKIGFIVEDITWSGDYRHAATDVIQNQFPNNFVVAGDDTLG